MLLENLLKWVEINAPRKFILKKCAAFPLFSFLLVNFCVENFVKPEKFEISINFVVFKTHVNF